EIAGVEAHAVERVGLLALAVGVRIREDERTVHGSDHAVLAARVTGQPGVSLRRVGAREDPITRCEARRRPGLTEVSPLLRRAQHAVEELRVAVRRRRIDAVGQLGHAALELLARGRTLPAPGPP